MLLREAMQRVRASGWQVGNADCTIIAQKPKLAPYKAAMVQSVADCLGVTAAQVNVKAKTAEKLGPVGEERSMEARAVVLLFPA